MHDGVSFSVPRGQIAALIGGSGSGKSVLVREIIGLLRPVAGTVRLLGTDVWSAPEEDLMALRRRFGMLFQDGALFSSLTVAQNVATPLIEHAEVPAHLLGPLVRLRIALAGLLFWAYRRFILLHPDPTLSWVRDGVTYELLNPKMLGAVLVAPWFVLVLSQSLADLPVAQRILSVLLRVAFVILVALGLSRLARTATTEKVCTVYLVDVSDSITDEELRRAGFSTRTELDRLLDSRPTGDVYRIEVRFVGGDPRAELRERPLDERELATLRTKLARLDAKGAWTEATLRLIAAQPEVRAADLTTQLGRDRASFKTDVRKLKALGLTEILEVGYRISTRGRQYLDTL